MANLTLVKGDDRGITFDWSVNITGGTVTFTAKQKVTDTAAVLSKSSADGGITLTDASAGQGVINITETDFSTLGKAETELQCSLRLVLSGKTTTHYFPITVITVP